MKLAIVDNYDSFTFNLQQRLAEVSRSEPAVFANDRTSWAELAEAGFDAVVISPGPGRPERPADFGASFDVIRNATVPVLGVCLGHQGIAHAFGGVCDHAPEPMHGRSSEVIHDGSALFHDIPARFSAVRYHSLLVREPLPACLVRTAWTADGLLMGLRHRDRPLWGVQFHPESICTEHGHRLLENFCTLAARHPRAPTRVRVFAPPEPPATPPRPAPASPFTLHTRAVRKPVDAAAVFVRFFGSDAHAFWLDSASTEAGRARFSFMGPGDGPHGLRVRYRTKGKQLTVEQGGRSTTTSEGLFEWLQRQLDLRRAEPAGLPFDLQGGFVGYLGYEMKAECGAATQVESPLPDACFVLADRLLAFDHHEGVVHVVALSEAPDAADAEAWVEATARALQDLVPERGRPPSHVGSPQPAMARDEASAQTTAPFELRRPPAAYLEDILECQRLIREGETYEACLTNVLRAPLSVDPLRLYLALRAINPAPYAAFLRMGETAIACSSPERFLRIDRAGVVESKPIKGTARRGATPAEDASLRASLQASEKDRAENLMIVDLVRNDLGRVCEVGSVGVPVLMNVESYATVHQLVSTVRGRLRPGATAVDAVRAAFPGGSMTGAPKLRTMTILEALEGAARGVYSGTIGYFSFGGAADLNIVIRTAVVTPGSVSVGVGGAIVALSRPDAELEEVRLKGRAVLEATLQSLT